MDALNPERRTGEAPRHRAAASARVRRYRKRQRNGGAVLRVEVADYFAVVGVLLDAGWLEPQAALDRRHVETALSMAVAEMASWQRSKV